ncbi:MAG: 6-phosphogluconolactonase [Halothiobacillus sp.]
MQHSFVHLHTRAQPEQVIAACAHFVVKQLDAAIAARGVARIALAGGNTPKALYDALASPLHRNEVDWQRVECYFGDERAVPQTHPDSNFGMAQRHLFTPLGMAPAQVFPMVSDPMLPLAEEAKRNQNLLTSWAGTGVPRFDFMLNGMGDDGHFASLFPDTPALTVRDHWVVVNPVAKLNTERLTLTYPVFEEARTVCFLVVGARKQAAFSAMMQPGSTLPVARLIQNRTTDWFVDEACVNRVTQKELPQ